MTGQVTWKQRAAQSNWWVCSYTYLDVADHTAVLKTSSQLVKIVGLFAAQAEAQTVTEEFTCPA